PGSAGGIWRRYRASQSPQNLLHPAWRRRPRHGPDRREKASYAVPARSLGMAERTRTSRGHQRRAVQLGFHHANFIAKRLEGHYVLLYKGPHGRVAHECIIDTRPFKDAAGVSVEDIAKRL